MMSSTSVMLEAVEAFMAVRRKRGIGFPPTLERQFEADMHARRCARLTIGILVSAAIYNLFLVADWLLVPDVFVGWSLAAARAAVRRSREAPWDLVITSSPPESIHWIGWRLQRRCGTPWW